MADRTGRAAAIYEGTRIPSPIPTVLQVPEELRASDDILTVNFGPNHPSTHGVLRLIVDLHGEEVVGLAAVVGYLHTGFEKNMEQKTLVEGDHVRAAHRLRLLPEQRARVRAGDREAARTRDPAEGRHGCARCSAELNRIHSHLVWLGTAALELGAISMFWYCFRERDQILDLFELVAGVPDAHALLPGRRARRGHPAGLLRRMRASSSTGCRRRSTTTRRSSTATRSGSSARRASASSRRTTRSRSASPGPVLRGSGVDWDLRRAQPYLAYDQVDFRVPVYEEGDVYARYRVRMEEMRESVKIVDAVARPAMPDGAVDRRRPQGRPAAA